MTFTMLSDPDSRVIRDFGILNTEIEPGTIPFYGIPFPGTYLLDEDGVVTHSFFEKSYKRRENPHTILEAALGRVELLDDEPQEMGGDDEVRVQVNFHGGAIKQGVHRRVNVRFEMTDGLHVYGEPVPEGMVPVQIEVTGPDGFMVEDPVYPPTELLHLDGIDAPLPIWSDTVDIQVPVYAQSKLASEVRPLQEDTITIQVSVRYQACNDVTCLLPKTETFDLTVPIDTIDVPSLDVFVGNGQKELGMSPKRHMLRLILRHLRRNPRVVLRMLYRQVIGGRRSGKK